MKKKQKLSKLILGIAVGFVGYMAYKKLKGTQTVIVDTFDTPMPNILDVSRTA